MQHSVSELKKDFLLVKYSLAIFDFILFYIAFISNTFQIMSSGLAAEI